MCYNVNATVNKNSNFLRHKWGSLLINNKQFMTVNGYSTVYHGFGGEEEDIAHR